MNVVLFIIKVIEEVNCCKEVDVLIVGCGGGLIEEFWVFNEESVVCVIFIFIIFVILVVGYEIDFIIVDFVVDFCVFILIGVVELVVFYISEIIERLI